MLSDTLKKIVDGTPGAKGAILMGFDGIIIELYKAKGSEDLDLDTLMTEFSFRVDELRKAAESLELGVVSEISIKTADGALLFRTISEEFFSAVLLSDSAHCGQGRWRLRSTIGEITAEL
jgi:predicted regulator of Ras-like GTPase activity (Roadblock/LC7/MglB family)